MSMVSFLKPSMRLLLLSFLKEIIYKLLMSLGRFFWVIWIIAQSFTKPVPIRPVMNEVFFYSLSDDDKYLIESTFLIDEINEVVWLSDFDKSPSLDDFPLGFLKSVGILWKMM